MQFRDVVLHRTLLITEKSLPLEWSTFPKLGTTFMFQEVEVFWTSPCLPGSTSYQGVLPSSRTHSVNEMNSRSEGRKEGREINAHKKEFLLEEFFSFGNLHPELTCAPKVIFQGTEVKGGVPSSLRSRFPVCVCPCACVSVKQTLGFTHASQLL